MHKAFFGCVLALPVLSVSTLSFDEDTVAAQIADTYDQVDDFSMFGQVEAGSEDEAFWNQYLSQVDAVLEADASTPYWTDGYTSLSQAEVEAILNNDADLQNWGKGGLAQTDADGIEVLGHMLSKVKSTVGDVANGAIMAIEGASAATADNVAAYFKANPQQLAFAKKMKAGAYSAAKISEDLLKKKVVPVAHTVALISDIPGMDVLLPGIKQAGGIAKMVEAGAKDGSTILGAFLKKDDGKGSCWIKSELRHFQFTTKAACTGGKEYGKGGICYNACPAKHGSGLGPVCWGQCNSKIHSKCGPLCLLKAEKTKCSDVVKGVAESAISTGVNAAGGNYIGAVLGGISVASKLAYPICQGFN